MLYTKFSGNEATYWGLSQEKTTAFQYTQWKQQMVHLQYLLTRSVVWLYQSFQMILLVIPKVQVHLKKGW